MHDMHARTIDMKRSSSGTTKLGILLPNLSTLYNNVITQDNKYIRGHNFRKGNPFVLCIR